MRTLANIASFAARQAFAVAVVILVGCVFWTVAYFSLLLWAMVAGGGVGSPIVYPLGLLGILCGATVASLLLFLPATLAAEVLCRWRSWPTLVGIPFSFAVFCVLSLVWSSVAHLSRQFVEPSLWSLALGLIVTLSVPLGLYWWAAEFPYVIRDVVRVVRSFWNRRKKITEPGASPNGGPPTSFGNSGGSGGPPSVS